MSIEQTLAADAAPGAGASPQPFFEDTPDALIESCGISRRLWRLYAFAWFICLLFPALALMQGQRSTLQLASALLGVALFVGCYVWVMWPTH